jgi:uncharacterized C2H2 Zn-finger protein
MEDLEKYILNRPEKITKRMKKKEVEAELVTALRA